MISLQPLLTLLAQSESERDSLQARWLKSQTTQRAAQAQCDQLLAYRRDYEQRWGAQFRSEGKIELVHCYQGFVQRLSLAVDQQALTAQQAQAQVDLALVAVREAELRVASVRKLIDRRVQEIRQQSDRSDQKQSDEFAARVAWGRSAALRRPQVV